MLVMHFLYIQLILMVLQAQFHNDLIQTISGKVIHISD